MSHIITRDMDNEKNSNYWEGYADWRNRPAIRGRHGGVVAASFVLIVEVLENLAYLANASNLVLYLTKYMNFSPSASANTVTCFMGTAFLLALLGGFLSDSYLTTYCIYVISAITQLVGLLILALQAHLSSLQPPVCSSHDRNAPCRGVDHRKKAVLYAGLYLAALGVGGIKGSLPPHGAHQFDERTQRGRKQRSAFFNYYVFCLSFGALIAVTFVVWVEDNIGWQWGFGAAAVAIFISIPIFLLGSATYRIKVPSGSPITTIFKVLISATRSLRATPSSRPTRTIPNTTFLDRAISDPDPHDWLHCTESQVEDSKSVLRTLPIFASTVMLNCCLAQLSTFSVQQAATMDTRLAGTTFRVPPASLPVFPVLFVLILAPVYNHVILPFFSRRATGSEPGITHLQRIGTGLVFSVLAMATAALVETKRKRAAARLGLSGSTEPIPITFLWMALQYLFLGSADLFSLAGQMEFFFSEAPTGMRSLATSLSWASLAVGYYLSSVLVGLVNWATGGLPGGPWLRGSNLNRYRLERFYWLMCGLSGLNLLQYVFWARRYRYRVAAGGGGGRGEEEEDDEGGA
ncbi:major facilitator superfamily protein [Striga asiatica]|uniref:Major facilitator superfamily protein n=1 Tax=Striga asiatica TaxID=4170 RepID=A0A5A7R5T8_STRAF|nr:major facilitator superfamily protein [Striga asiatica]